MSIATPISDDELLALFAGLETTPLALAVSGGADSMALMHMTARWARRDEVQAAYRQSWRNAIDARSRVNMAEQWSGLHRPSWLEEISTADHLMKAGGTPHVVVLTVDHGLRATSADEARFVAAASHELGLPCVTLVWQGAKPESALQEAARGARRDLMLDVLRAERAILCELGNIGGSNIALQSARCLVMAHQQEDQAETVLMRLARGSGLEGLGGMRPRDIAMRAPTSERPEHFIAEVLRPLLDVPKARLVATLQSYGARWVEDPSNEDERFERVRVRKMMPLLAELGLNADKIALSARRLRDADQALESCMGAIQSRLLPKFETPPSLRPHVGDAAFELRFAYSPYLLVRTLRWLTRAYGGAARPAELSQLEELARTMREAAPGAFAGATLGGCKIELHDMREDLSEVDLAMLDAAGVPRPRRIRVFREGSGEVLPNVAIEPGQKVDWDGGRFVVVAQASASPGAVIRALGHEGWVEVKKRVPGLAKLGLPAAAVATLPVVADAETGQVISYNALDGVLRHMRRPQVDNPDEAVPTPVWEEWQASGLTGGEYHIMFKGLTARW